MRDSERNRPDRHLMAFFVVSMSHPDGPKWNRHVLRHVRYLIELIHAGKLKASGPLTGTRLRSGLLIFVAQDRQEVEALVAEDPFAKEGLIVDLRIEQWDPLFGSFSHDSSKMLPKDLEEFREELGL